MIPRETLDELAPFPDLHKAVEALKDSLESWRNGNGNGPRLRILLGAPGSYNPEVIGEYAKTCGFPVVESPDPAVLLSGGEDWDGIPDADGELPRVIPALERFYLRHYNGFNLIRRLAGMIHTGEHNYLVGCDTWAWAYLARIIGIDNLFPSPFILEAFDSDHLCAWLRGLPSGKSIQFRQSDDGSLIFPPGDDDLKNNSDGSQARVGDYLRYLASGSRGMPGVALELWRSSLRLAASGEALKKAPLEEMGETVWVQPWNQLKTPSLPGVKDESIMHTILHALLIHNGLPPGIPGLLFTDSDREVERYCRVLAASDIIVEADSLLRVSRRAYPHVRYVLNREGYLVDGV